MGDRRVLYRDLVGKIGKGSLGRHKRRWENNITTDFQEVKSSGMC